jgi:hypothetical protein
VPIAKTPQAPRRERKAPDRDGPGREPAKPSQRPLYVFLSEPGLSSLALLELRRLKVVARKARPLRLKLRNYDMLVLPADVVFPEAGRSRLCTNVLRAPIFGRSGVTPRQLDNLASLFRRGGRQRLVSSLAGDRFNRPELVGWVRRQLLGRGVILGEAGRAIWMIVVDDAFYFCEELQNHHDAPGRDQASSRSGALPPTIGAAMVFAAQLAPDDVVWEPVAGSGGLVNELFGQQPDLPILATDTDADAVAALRRRFAGAARLWSACADAASVALPRRDVTLTIANLPFGERYKSAGGNAALYSAILRNSLAHAPQRWRGVFLTSDAEAMSEAARKAGVTASITAEVKVRGVNAAIWQVERT